MRSRPRKVVSFLLINSTIRLGGVYWRVLWYCRRLFISVCECWMVVVDYNDDQRLASDDEHATVDLWSCGVSKVSKRCPQKKQRRATAHVIFVVADWGIELWNSWSRQQTFASTRMVCSCKAERTAIPNLNLAHLHVAPLGKIFHHFRACSCKRSKNKCRKRSASRA